MIRGHLLMERIRQAETDAPKPMSGFAGFLRRDLDAVTAWLTLTWSSGVVEGQGAGAPWATTVVVGWARGRAKAAGPTIRQAHIPARPRRTV
ncbi:hypothetical protein ACFRU3_14095 [Streptomyces sp. NPDC056910]|uniref:hypothetical protein n=1 Tax=Streptomyces sp. NPDC056910 TaxID=3345964 RepID=UPI00368DD65E